MHKIGDQMSIFFAKDPDGYLVEIVYHKDPIEWRPSPDGSYQIHEIPAPPHGAMFGNKLS
ncbi:MAG: hypothetical protein QM605_03875 [Sphingobium sp.]